MYSFEGHVPSTDILEAVRRGEIAAFWLFGSNLSSPAQLRDLSDALRRFAREGGHPPPLLAIDQEGGQLVAITGGATELPGNMALGATRSPALAEQAGHVLGRELLAMGINLNFAPSLDVNVNPANPVIGIRSFGDDAALVAELGAALIRGTQASGVMATAKHFPGHGDTAVDTHNILPVVPHSIERLDAVELAPFQAAIDAGVSVIMTAHVMFSALDNQYPATISRATLKGLLRRDLGFGGLVITDAMDMQAVAQYGTQESVRMALHAGADLALLGSLPDHMALGRQLDGFARPESLARIRAAQANIRQDLPPLDVVGCAEHQAIARSIADQSITLVRDQAHLLPLSPGPDDLIAVITPRPTDLTPADTSSQVRIALADAIRRRHPRTLALEIPYPASADAVRAILQAAAQAQIVVVGTISVDRDPGQVDLVQALERRGQAPVVVALRTPYDLMAFPTVQSYLCTYGIRPVSMEATARVLFGEIEARGVLPCAIPGVIASRD
jgi:beta-N-acetylhexosaminidase